MHFQEVEGSILQNKLLDGKKVVDKVHENGGIIFH